MSLILVLFIEERDSERDSTADVLSFFKIIKKTKAKFISGPFTQMIFDIIEDKGKKLKILLDNINNIIDNSYDRIDEIFMIVLLLIAIVRIIKLISDWLESELKIN